MKIGDRVIYDGNVYPELKGKKGIIRGKSSDNNTMWAVDFGVGDDKDVYDCYETSLRRVDGQLCFHFSGIISCSTIRDNNQKG